MQAQSARFLTAEWRTLAMLNYEIDPAILGPFVPAGTELDFWNGRTFVSIVGFRFLRTRVLGVPIPFHCNFDEVNLRFYVRHKAAGEWRRGVVFIKELVPRWAIAFVARHVYHENYVALPMRHTVPLPNAGGAPSGPVSYEWWRQGAWNGLYVDIAGEPVLAPDDSEETFITEHYWGYCMQPDGSTLEYQVEHPRWRVWQAAHPRLVCDVAALYGDAFVERLAGPPSSAFVADGSPVMVRRGRPIESRK